MSKNMMSSLENKISKLLPQVEKPGRYAGGELNQVVKDWTDDRIKVGLVFPDIYDLGMSNLGLAILYDLINKSDALLAERIYAPWTDMESVMRENDIPLYSLETKHPLNQFDLVGISLPYETLYTNTLNILDLGNIPIFSTQRTEDDPIVIAGGHATFNPEPMHKFIDAFVIGEGEEAIFDIIKAIQDWDKSKISRADFLKGLSKIWGVYVPSMYEPLYHPDGTIKEINKLDPDIPDEIIKRIVPVLPPPVTDFIVPYVDVVHNRAPIEIMRGCTRGCRFCHAGMVTRPVRERSTDEVIEAIEKTMNSTGYEEIGLLSLSSSDYTHVVKLVEEVNTHFADKNLSISLPSLRIESTSVELMDALASNRKGGFTLAPEAATEKMREIINKPVSTEELLSTTREIYSRGWPTIKLYFMIGHPSETMEDVQAIADLCKAVLKEGRQVLGHRAKVHAGVSTFVPKPHTPFQWVPCDTMEQIEAKQELLRRELRGHGLKLNWNDPRETMLEAWLSRGDRRISDVIYEAWKLGAKFDAWQEHFAYDAWMSAFEKVGLDPTFYTHRTRYLDEIFPWEHIDTTVRKKFLTQDYLWSQKGKTRVDCRNQCFACGILPTFSDFRREHPGDAWQCPEVKNNRVNVKNEFVTLDSVMKEAALSGD